MTGTFNHDLNILCPCTLCKLAEADKFLNLANITSVGKTAGTAGVAQGDCDIIFTADVKNFIKILIERILFACHTHPCENKRAAA